MTVMLIRYPTMAQVKAADQPTLKHWYKTLPGAGSWALHLPREEYEDAVWNESRIIAAINRRIKRAN